MNVSLSVNLLGDLCWLSIIKLGFGNLYKNSIDLRYIERMIELLKINNLIVEYNDAVVLNINDITVSSGDIVGIIGQNGSGKSTLIDCILDEIKYEGRIERNFKKEDVGVQFQVNSYNNLMKVRELIRIVTKQNKFNSELQLLIERFEIKDMLEKRISVLSGGEKQRLTLFLVLYLKPKIIFFDELTTGLDYEKRKKLLKIVREYSKGKTVFIVTHYFDELENWATKLLVLKQGKPIFWGTPGELSKLYPHYGVLKLDNSFENNEFNIIKDRNDDSSILVVKDIEEQIKAIDMLNRLNISFEARPSNIYSLYILLMNDLSRNNTSEVEEHA